KEYNKRKLGELMKKLKEGDVIIVSEISRLARSVFMLFRIVEFCNETKVTIYSVKDSINTVKPNDLTSMMMIFCFGIAAQIEREMIIKRTNEGLERARNKGVILGRPVGAESKRKLTGKDELIKEYAEAGLGVTQIARVLGVHRGTLDRHCKLNDIHINTVFNTHPCKYNKWHLEGIRVNKIINDERDYIISFIDAGYRNKWILEKLNEKGYNISMSSFIRYLRNNKEFYDYYKQKNTELRLEKNVECGKNKR
ncbi:MAG: recombinase family protein, partial [Firmicutes bacterium]|nr:recombinase family protein [Bacillota bacterium]